MISEDGQTCTVTFDGYGTTEIVRVDDLSSRDWEPPSITAERHKAKSSRFLNSSLVPYLVHVMSAFILGFLTFLHNFFPNLRLPNLLLILDKCKTLWGEHEQNACAMWTFN